MDDYVDHGCFSEKPNVILSARPTSASSALWFPLLSVFQEVFVQKPPIVSFREHWGLRWTPDYPALKI